MTLKSGYRMGHGRWKLHQWILHVSFPISHQLYPRPYLVSFMRYGLRWVHHRPILLYPSCVQRRRRRFAWDDLRKILHGYQRMAKVHRVKNYCQKLQSLEQGARTFRQTTDRQIDRRQTDLWQQRPERNVYALCAVYLARFLCYWRLKTPVTLKSEFRMG